MHYIFGKSRRNYEHLSINNETMKAYKNMKPYLNSMNDKRYSTIG